ncbi:endonuclease NucS domain-containing protein [Hypericibacter adhaerens]|nr:endonuclease NucS domain-containing protein [Hypericibacter adhaerens]
MANMSASRSYYRIMLGAKSSAAQQCHEEKWFGGGWGIAHDLTSELTENWREFNAKFIPVYLNNNPGKSKVAAGLACGMLHTICKGIQQGDIVLCPDGKGSYWAGTVVSDYFYTPGEKLPHRRHVEWFPKAIARSEMSEALRNSTGAIGTVSDITKHAQEIEGFLAGNASPKLIATDELVEDPSIFALESHLEDFLVENWVSTELGKNYDIFREDGEAAGQQYPTDTGPIDILALRKDKKELLVVELKKGRASDAVVGQIQRYMGYVLDELAEPDQTVRGCIIALEDDLRLRRALRAANNIDFYRYQVSFKLFKG